MKKSKMIYIAVIFIIFFININIVLIIRGITKHALIVKSYQDLEMIESIIRKHDVEEAKLIFLKVENARSWFKSNNLKIYYNEFLDKKRNLN